MSSPRLPLSSRPAFLPDEISKREFATVFRGYDPAEVRTFLNQLSEQAAEMSDRIAEIQKALAQTEERVKNPELDEEMVTKLLGEQTAQILRSAREAANETRAKAEAEVSRQLRDAHEVTSKMREEAETLLAQRTEEAERMAESVRKEAADAAEQMRSEAQEEAAGIRAEVAEEAEQQRAGAEASIAEMQEASQREIEEERQSARAEAQELVDTARAEAQALVERTQEKQTEMLEAITRKRKIALAQVEELRAGRQRLLKSYKMVRGTLDEVTAELERVEDEARQAAELAGVRAAQSADIPQEELDTVIEMEHYELADDVPPSVIDLINGETSSEESAPAPTSGGFYDVDADTSSDDSGGNDSGGSGDERVLNLTDTAIENDEDSGSTEQRNSGSSSSGPVATLERQMTMEEIQVITEADPSDSAEDDEDGQTTQVRSSSSSFIIGESFAMTAGREMDQGLQVRREAAVSKAGGQAVRRLKRCLQDEQDGLVVRLRSGDGQSVQALLGSAEDQAATYNRAIVKLFKEVVRTGASSVEGSTGVERGTIDRTGASAARGLAGELVEDLRGQLQPVLEELLAGGSLPENNTLQSLVAAPYRAVKGEYLEQLVEERISGAFDQGVAFSR